MYSRIHLPGALVLAALAACEQNPVRALPADHPSSAIGASTAAGAPIYGGAEQDYQPSLIRRRTAG